MKAEILKGKSAPNVTVRGGVFKALLALTLGLDAGMG